PLVALAGQETLAEGQLELAVPGAALVVVSGVVDQHPLNVVGMADEMRLVRPDAKPDDVAELVNRIAEEADRIRRKSAEEPAQPTQGITVRARRRATAAGG